MYLRNTLFHSLHLQEQIIGRSIGQTFDIAVTYPDTYEINPDLTGQEVTYAVTIKSIKEMEPSLKEEKEEIRKTLEAEAAKTQQQEQFEQIQDYLIEQTEVIKEPEEGREVIELIIETIAEKENLNLSEKELNERLDQYAIDYGYQDRDEFINSETDQEQLEKSIQTEVVMEWLLDHAKEIE